MRKAKDSKNNKGISINKLTEIKTESGEYYNRGTGTSEIGRY